MAATVAYHGRHPRRTGEDSEYDDSELIVITAWTIGVPKARRGRLRLMTVNALGVGTKKTPTPPFGGAGVCLGVLDWVTYASCERERVRR